MNESERRSRLVPGGERIFQRIYTRLGCEGRPPHFVVEYHPYADLTHTIRLREDTAYVRVSDLLRDAPRSIFEAAAGILLGQAVSTPAARGISGCVSKLFLRSLDAPQALDGPAAARAPRGTSPGRRLSRPRSNVRAAECQVFHQRACKTETGLEQPRLAYTARLLSIPRSSKS